ncbi:MAG: ATP phosphoribosyltransferase regulatory subunit [Pseudomonadota bacterium]
MTIKANRWLLPDGVDEILPPRANQLETLRREILDLYNTWGYDLIKTPLIEFLDSLLVVPSHELQLSTFNIVDQLSGKNMGVRADISTQAARIDSHVLQQTGPTRLCYADSVLITRPKGQLGSRSPQLVGAELYGHSGTESDVEVISLMLNTLSVVGIEKPLLALGHNRICRTLLKAANLTEELEDKLFSALQNKATADITKLLQVTNIAPQLRNCLALLSTMHGDIAIIGQAETIFGEMNGCLPDASQLVLQEALKQLRTIAECIQTSFPTHQLYFDLCELQGYDYHTGIIFSAYVAGHGEAIANGGRYDDIGAVFGRARAATGFNADLKTLLSLSKREFTVKSKVFAPAVSDPILQTTINQLRAQGHRVVQAFSGQAEMAAAMGCTQQLVQEGDSWKVYGVH